ncbi:cysteine--tRNA ligase [Candidatus Dependentiae bacterium]|nr:cysteine--tRNA ligase [Candidatus Dependentiae bacterium]
MSNLRLTNTLTGLKEQFVPLEQKNVKMYVCGITPYDYAHIGHARVYVTFDVLFRLLKFLNYNVTYVRNFTDVDDKLINRAIKEYKDASKYIEIAQKYIADFHEQMKKLNCLNPTFEPKVTENIKEIIEFIEQLISLGKAYVVGGDVYYSIGTFSSYGKLSKRTREDVSAGARVEIREEKRDPSDFALWKSSTDVGWQSPWGLGRPGWHIECSAMAKKYLADRIDIHGGGMDLIFPHHENEIAQTEGLTGFTFAKYWLHNAFVTVNQEKMSKSLGNFVTLNDIFKKIDPVILRFYFLNHHYRTPIDFSYEALQGFSKAYHRLCIAFENIKAEKFNFNEESDSVITKILDFSCDDMNIPGMFGVIFDNLKEIQNPKIAGKVKFLLQEILGLPLIVIEKHIEITPEIQALLHEREKARIEKNWSKSDEIRDKLKELGYDVHDKKLNP